MAYAQIRIKCFTLYHSRVDGSVHILTQSCIFAVVKHVHCGVVCYLFQTLDALVHDLPPGRGY